MDGVVEIITGRERRRRWSIEQKLKVVGETQEPGARVSQVAARHGVCESLVFSWRRQAREGSLVSSDVPVFLPVQMSEAAPLTVVSPVSPSHLDEKSPSSMARPRSQAGLIEIELGDGRQVRVGSDVNLAALRRVLIALRG
jgi:transposase